MYVAPSPWTWSCTSSGAGISPAHLTKSQAESPVRVYAILLCPPCSGRVDTTQGGRTGYQVEMSAQRSHGHRALGKTGRFATSQQATNCSFFSSYATYVDKEGKAQKSTEWYRIVIPRKMALSCDEHLKKGRRQVFVEGRLRTREWENNGAIGRALRSWLARPVPRNAAKRGEIGEELGGRSSYDRR